MDIYSLYIILVVLAVHYIADFIFQTREQAENKSSSIGFLLSHVMRYSNVVFIGLQAFIVLPLINYDATFYHPAVVGTWGLLGLNVLTLLYINITHFGVDYITSRINARLYKKKKMNEFWNLIGLDQLLHLTSLYLLLTIYV